MEKQHQTVKINATLDVTYEVDGALFGHDPKKAIEQAIAIGQYDFEGTGDVYDFSIHELHEKGFPFTRDYLHQYGNPQSASHLEYSLPIEAIQALNSKKNVSL